MNEVQWSATLDPETFEVFAEELNTICYGHDGRFYWYETPDGVRGRSLTRGKMLAALSAVRIHHPGIKLELVGKLPPPKRRR
jgi:hypothetical protein